MVFVENLPPVDTKRRTFEQEDLPRLNVLREICHKEEINSAYEREIFALLFPEELSIEDFRQESVEFSQETKLTKEQKRLRRCLLWVQGYKPRKEVEKKGYVFSDQDVPEFEVYFRKKEGTLLDDLNHLPIFERLNEIAQTDHRYSTYSNQRHGETHQQWLSRAQHTKHLAKTVSYSVFRLALKQPEEFISKVEQDLQRYSALGSDNTTDFVLQNSSKEEKKVNKFLRRHGFATSDVSAQAIRLAFVYSKYLLTAAYLHDVATPALGDLFMKTFAEEGSTDQQSAEYSEDRVLAERIAQWVDPITGIRTGLPQFITKHHLNRELLTIMVREMALERDTCLGGLLMKNKRKFEEEVEHPLKNQQSYDLDQESGTITNAMKWINGIYTNGCRYFDPDDVPPIGSFEERLRFFVYLLATGKSKKEANALLKQAGIPKNRMYIAIEEFSVGQNMMLATLPGHLSPTNELSLVITRPADVKKAITMFVINQLFEYRSSLRAPTEAAVQTVLSCGLFKRVITQEVFEQRGDYEALAILDQKLPLVSFLFFLMDQAAIVNQEELIALQASSTVLTHAAHLGNIIPWKPGTLVRTEDGEIEQYLKILQRDRTEHQITKTQSLPSRLESIQTMVDTKELYYAIVLSVNQKETLDVMLTDERLSEETRQVMRTALSYWNYDVA